MHAVLRGLSGRETVRRQLLACVAVAFAMTGGAAPVLASDADVVADARACAATSDPAKRLQCFDLMIGQHALNALPPSTSTATGNWAVREGKSPVDDSKTLLAHLQASQASGGGMLDNPSAELVVWCQEGRLDVYMVASDYFGSTSPMGVLIRVDTHTARGDRWRPSSNGRAVGLWASDGTKSRAFAEELAESHSLVLRSDVYRGAPLTAQFDTTGAKLTLEPILALCSAKQPAKKR